MDSKKVIFVVSSIISAFFLTGCLTPQKYAESVILSDVAEQSVPVRDETVATRFQEPATHGSAAIGSMMELSEKYIQLSQEAALSRQRNQDLLTERQQLKDKLANYDANLKQTQKELTEANNLLIDMRIELNNWKTDILGFREEIRQADIEQLRALINILGILGGEFKVEPAKSEENPQASESNITDAEDIDSAVVSLDESAQVALKK